MVFFKIFLPIFGLTVVLTRADVLNVVDKNNYYQDQGLNSINKYSLPVSSGVSYQNQHQISRDSYTDAATNSQQTVVSPSASVGGYSSAAGVSSSGGYGVPDQDYGGQKFHYQIMPNPAQSYGLANSNSNDEDNDDDFDLFGSSSGGNSNGLGGFGGGAGGGGIGSLIGLKGLKKAKVALKILKWIKIFKIFGPVLWPIAIPLLFPLILIFAPILLLPLLIFLPLLLLPLLFIPIPVITIPSNGRMWGFGSESTARTARSLASSTGRLVQDVLSSEECVERIVCEISTRFQPASKVIETALNNVGPKPDGQGPMIKRISRAIKNKSTNCAKYFCNPIRYFRKTFNL